MEEGLHQALRTLLGERCTRRDGQVQIAPATERELYAVLGLLRGAGARLNRDVFLSREGLSRIGAIEPRSAVVSVEAGVRLEALERALRAQQLTLGPLSPGAWDLELGEFLEGGHAGLRAVRGGRLEPIAMALTALTPDGAIYRSHPSPRSAAGPELDALLLGSGGAFGIVLSAWVRCFPLPASRRAVAYRFDEPRSATRALLAALGDGCWLDGARMERTGEGIALEVTVLGTADGVESDLLSLAGRAVASGGRVTEVRDRNEDCSTRADPVQAERSRGPTLARSTLRAESSECCQPDGGIEREASWEAIAEAVAHGASLALHRLAISSAIAEGAYVGVPVGRASSGWSEGSPWDRLSSLIDPDAVLGGGG